MDELLLHPQRDPSGPEAGRAKGRGGACCGRYYCSWRRRHGIALSGLWHQKSHGPSRIEHGDSAAHQHRARSSQYLGKIRHQRRPRLRPERLWEPPFHQGELTGKLQPDQHWHEHATCFRLGDRGLVVIGSCGHADIMNTLRLARRKSAASQKSMRWSALPPGSRARRLSAPSDGRTDKIRPRARPADAFQPPELHRPRQAGDAGEAGALHDRQPLIGTT
jgi:hypothetical protein